MRDDVGTGTESIPTKSCTNCCFETGADFCSQFHGYATAVTSRRAKGSSGADGSSDCGSAESSSEADSRAGNFSARVGAAHRGAIVARSGPECQR